MSAVGAVSVGDAVHVVDMSTAGATGTSVVVDAAIDSKIVVDAVITAESAGVTTVAPVQYSNSVGLIL